MNNPEVHPLLVDIPKNASERANYTINLFHIDEESMPFTGCPTIQKIVSLSCRIYFSISYY